MNMYCPHCNKALFEMLNGRLLHHTTWGWYRSSKNNPPYPDGCQECGREYQRLNEDMEW